MNKQRRKDLDKVLEYLAAANQPLADALNDLEAIRDEEQEAADSVSEQFPGTERADMMQEAASALDEAFAAVEEMATQCDNAIEAIGQAQQ